jgi:hypothetical protein
LGALSEFSADAAEWVMVGSSSARWNSGSTTTFAWISDQCRLTNEGGKEYVTLAGTLSNSDSPALTFDRSPIVVNPQTHVFRLRYELRDKPFQVVVSIKKTNGEVQQGTLYVPASQLLASNLPKRTAPHSAWRVMPELDFLSQNYQQTALNSENAIDPVLRITATTRLGRGSRWTFAGSGYLSLLNLTKTDTSSLRIAGFDAVVGYELNHSTWDFLPASWTLIPGFGYSFDTTFFSQGQETFVYGYKNVSGPELSAKASHPLSNGGYLTLYASYSPSATAFSQNFTSNFKNTLGAGYTFPQSPNHHLISVFARFAEIYSFVADVKINDQRYSLGVGYDL